MCSSCCILSPTPLRPFVCFLPVMGCPSMLHHALSTTMICIIKSPGPKKTSDHGLWNSEPQPKVSAPFNSFFQGFASATETPTLHSIFSLHDMRLVQLLLSHNSWLTLCYFLSFCFFWMLFSTQEILWCYTSKSNTRCYSETLMLFSFLRHPTVGNSPVYSVTQHHHDRRCKKKGRHSHVSEKGNFIFIGTVRCQWQRNEQNRQSLRLYLSQFCAAFR